jgi:3-oxoacyl-[acyl-carrier protein] reductase
MDLELKGRRALITGASRGIGRGIALALAAEGCDVAVCARGAETLADTITELDAAGPGQVHGEPVDVTDEGALRGFVGRAAAAFGGIDLLVANAGGGPGGPGLDDADGDDWRATMDLNVTHTAVAARACAEHMGEGGAMLFIASVSGFRPQPKPQYAAAKAAVIHMAAALGRELGRRGIRVNALSPGSTLFPGGSWDRRRIEQADEFAAFAEREFPYGRLSTLDEVVEPALFLLSPRANGINGTNVVVDGGQNQPGMAGY